jgi:hypothetical protein
MNPVVCQVLISVILYTYCYVIVTIDRVSIGIRIYWTLTLVTTNIYYGLTELHSPMFAVTAAQSLH